MNIKEAAKQTGLTANTIRYYERIGVIAPIPRDQNGNRIMSDLEITWLEFSRDMRHAGISVENLIDYVQLVLAGDETVPARMELLADAQLEIDEHIAQLQATRTHLQFKIDNYDQHMIPIETKLK